MLTTQKKYYQIFKIILIGGIVILTNLFLNAGLLDSLYPEPQYQTFCPSLQINNEYKEKEICITEGGQWNDRSYPYSMSTGEPEMCAGGEVCPATIPIYSPINDFCDENFTCQKNYDTAYQSYNRNIFIVRVITGIILLIAGIFLTAYSTVAISLSLAGLLSLIIGTLNYWHYMIGWLRPVILGIGLVTLVWVGIKKFHE